MTDTLRNGYGMHPNIRSVNYKVGTWYDDVACGTKRFLQLVSFICYSLIYSLNEHLVEQLLSSRHCAQSCRHEGE